VTTGFENAREGLRATGASVSTYEVVEALDRHGREEGELLASYQRYTEEAASPAARYLVALILEDERRHHRVLEELATTIAWGGMHDDSGATVPSSPRSVVDRDLLEATRSLLRHERRDRAQLRHMRRRLHRYTDAPMWNLLIDIMRSDTDKHIRILRFILRESSGRRFGLRRLPPRPAAGTIDAARPGAGPGAGEQRDGAGSVEMAVSGEGAGGAGSGATAV